MPIINITMGPTTEEKKKEIIDKMTKTLMDITNMPEEKIFTIINDLPLENLGVGRKSVKELVASK